MGRLLILFMLMVAVVTSANAQDFDFQCKKFNERG